MTMLTPLSRICSARPTRAQPASEHETEQREVRERHGCCKNADADIGGSRCLHAAVGAHQRRAKADDGRRRNQDDEAEANDKTIDRQKTAKSSVVSPRPCACATSAVVEARRKFRLAKSRSKECRRDCKPGKLGRITAPSDDGGIGEAEQRSS